MHRHGLGKNFPGSLGFALWRWQVKLQTALGPFQGYSQASLGLRSGKCVLWDQPLHEAPLGHRELQNVVICAVTYNTGKVTT